PPAYHPTHFPYTTLFRSYAAGDTRNWWWPVPPDVKEVSWPADVARAETLSAFRDAFASLGYGECSGEDLEPGFEKIALFANDQGDRKSTRLNSSHRTISY